MKMKCNSRKKMSLVQLSWTILVFHEGVNAVSCLTTITVWMRFWTFVDVKMLQSPVMFHRWKRLMTGCVTVTPGRRLAQSTCVQFTSTDEWSTRVKEWNGSTHRSIVIFKEICTKSSYQALSHRWHFFKIWHLSLLWSRWFWLFPMTPQSPATETTSSTPWDCGPLKHPVNLTSKTVSIVMWVIKARKASEKSEV